MGYQRKAPDNYHILHDTFLMVFRIQINSKWITKRLHKKCNKLDGLDRAIKYNRVLCDDVFADWQGLRSSNLLLDRSLYD